MTRNPSVSSQKLRLQALRLHDQWRVRPRRMPTPDQAGHFLYLYTVYIYMYLVLPRDLDFILWEVSAVHKMLANVELEAQAERRCMN